MAEACYIPRFLPASFKGLQFEACDASSEHGRRGFTGEFPFSEETRDVDLGRKARKYQIKARFVRNTHVADANALIAVIESPGAGTLQHPTRGIVRARCETAKVSDELLEGYGATYVDLDFVEANDSTLGVGSTNVFGVPIQSFVGQVNSQLLAAYAPAASPFYERSAILASASGTSASLSRALTGSIGLAPEAGVWSQVANLNRMAASPDSNYDPAAVASTLQSGFAAIDRYASSPAAKYPSFKAVANDASQSSALMSTVGAQSQNAIFAATRLTAAAYMARAASQIVPGTMSEALGWIADVGGLLQQEQDAAQLACSPDFYLTIRTFKAKALAALTYAAHNAPVRVVYSFHGPISSMVAAYRIYGDAKRFRDVEAANPNMPCYAMGPDLIATKAAA